MSLLAFALLFGLVAQDPGAPAQNGPQVPNQQASQWDFLTAPPPQFSMAQVTPEQKRLLVAQARQLAANSNGTTCYAIRSYVFRRQDGNAPVLVGTTTCTPAEVFRRKNAGRPPVPKLIPLNY